MARGRRDNDGPWLADDQKLRLSAMAIETARRRDPRTPVFLSVDHPGANHWPLNERRFPPSSSSISCLRADVEIAGIGLEINYGYWPGGSLPRDVLEVTEHVNMWALLGLPLILHVHDSQQPGSRPTWRAIAASFRQRHFRGGLSPQDQKRTVDQFFPALLAKQSVQALVWNQVFDSLPHRYAHGGLFNAQAFPSRP